MFGFVCDINSNTCGPCKDGFFGESCQGCGGEINAESGQLQSPNHPNIYQNNQSCTWTITGPIGFSVVLTFENFEVRYNFINIIS